MRRGHWWRSLTVVSQQAPPQIVESAMLLLALGLCGAWWFLSAWPYLVLCLSYIVGAIASILVRELIAPSSHTWRIRCTAVVSLAMLLAIVGFYVVQTVRIEQIHWV